VADSKLHSTKGIEQLYKSGKSSAIKRKRLNKIINETSSNELSILEESLPRVLGTKTFAQKFTAEVKHHHRWLGVIFHFSENFPRALRVLSLSANIIVMLFVQSVTYNLTNPDDGSCRGFLTKEACLRPESPFGTGQSMCAWSGNIGSKATLGSCSFIEPSNDFTVVLFVAIFSAIVSTPIAVTQNWIIRKYLANPTKENDVIQVDIDNSKKERNRSLLTFLTTSLFYKKSKIVDDSVTPEIRALSSQLKLYRETLTVIQRHEFDHLWGLDSKGEFLSDQSHRRIEWASFLYLSKAKVNVYNTVLLELQRVSERERREKLFIDSPDVSDREKARRLLHLFQCDLLPGISGHILNSKSSRDKAAAHQAVFLWQKSLGYGCIFIVNAAMLFYIFLFALQQSKNRQDAWFKSFLLWLLTEIVFISTISVLVLHQLVPAFIMKDIHKLKNKCLILYATTKELFEVLLIKTTKVWCDLMQQTICSCQQSWPNEFRICTWPA